MEPKDKLIHDYFASPASQNEPIFAKDVQTTRISGGQDLFITKNIHAQNLLEDTGFLSAEEDSVFDEEQLSIKGLISRIESEIAETEKSARFLRSSEIIEDFRRFSERPRFLSVAPPSPVPRTVHSKNMYNKRNLLFSCADSRLSEVVFRGPGMVLPSRPILSLANSILVEDGVMHYVRVATEDLKSTWYLLKRLETPEIDLALVSRDDRALSSFIQSDIVDTVYKRTSYLLYNGSKAVGRFVGKDLCISIYGKCIKTLKMADIEKIGRKALLVDETTLEFSCETERNEWVKAMQ